MPTIPTGGLEGLANFLDDFMGGIQLISFAITLGALIWIGYILPGLNRVTLPSQPDRSEGAQKLVDYGLGWVYAGAFTLAAGHAISLLAKAWVLKETLGQLPLAAYLGTTQFQAGFLRMLFGLSLGIAARNLRHSPHDPIQWRVVAGLMAAVILCGAWLTHGVGRFENRAMLMLFTLVHQIAGAIWFGGVVQLIVFWRVARSSPQLRTLWPQVLHRFSSLGLIAVATLLFTGLPLAWSYVNSLTALIGTGYGSLLLTKVILLGVALGFAWLNYRAGKRWEKGHSDPDLQETTPHIIEAEAFILVSLLFVAATLSSQPPAVDIPNLTVTPAEVWNMFSPKWPQLNSSTHEDLLIAEAQRAAIVGMDTDALVASKIWSDFNHNVSGIFVTGMALIALIGYIWRIPWTKQYWPLGFIGLGFFLFFRSDAQAWPLGPLGFWESTFSDGEILQHRMATVLVFFLGGLEIRARTCASAKHLRYMFPILCAFGGILLLTHSHAGFELETEYLIQSTHTVMGLIAVLIAAARWLELKLKPPAAIWAGITAMGLMGLVGLILMFYDEPLY
ncbi:MAG: CopD family protein [Methylohalobius crimeensis]